MIDRLWRAALAAGLAAFCGACVTDALTSDQSQLTAVLGVQSDGSQPSPAAADPAPAPTRQELRGQVSGPGTFVLFDLGASDTGDEWTISRSGFGGGGAVVAVLLDEDQNLLMREFMSGSAALRHVMREPTSRLTLGVAGVAGGGTSFVLNVTRSRSAAPAPQTQVVYLNFEATTNVRVHRRDPISFAGFDAAMIGERYVGATHAIRRKIVESIREDYADYDVLIYSSDEGPPPEGEFSTLHFGGSDPSLLGLADDVDDYNSVLSQNAIIYVQGFAIYWTMELTPDELAVMIANVASHELGHLLGLYHTRSPQDVMDTTGTAWDLASPQQFSRAALEASVFPIGFEDSPRRLSHAVGLAPESTKAATAKSAKLPLERWLRRISDEDMPQTCGTCVHLNEPRPQR